MNFTDFFQIIGKAYLADAAIGACIVAVGAILFFAFKVLKRYFQNKK